MENRECPPSGATSQTVRLGSRRWAPQRFRLLPDHAAGSGENLIHFLFFPSFHVAAIPNCYNWDAGHRSSVVPCSVTARVEGVMFQSKIRVACLLMLFAAWLLGAISVSAANPLPNFVVLNADYPPGMVFHIALRGSNRIRIVGPAPNGFSDYRDRYHGHMQVWFAGKDGGYRIAKSRGILILSHQANGRTTERRVRTDGRAEFNPLGYPKHGPSAPTDLLPIFPAHPVAAGDSWMVTAEVREMLGQGPAAYTYRVQRIERGRDGHVLAVISFEIHAALAPPPAIAGWLSTINGHGVLVWDCTVNQRASEKFHILYTASNPAGKGRHRITEERVGRERVTRARAPRNHHPSI